MHPCETIVAAQQLMRISPRALSTEERDALICILNSKEHWDMAPPQVYMALLDRGRYAASVSTMYRVLRSRSEVHERRNQLSHPLYARPELMATKVNELWSWDITKLRGAIRGAYYCLYVILDVFSRYIVGWTLQQGESQEIASELIAQTCEKQQVEKGQLTIHADRGSAMTSKTVAELMMDLGVTKSHSRPHVSNDNPFSEAQFKTMKYRPEYPARFGSIEEATVFCVAFFAWYNTVHYHSGIAMLTPEIVHYGRAAHVLDERARVLAAAHCAHPERFIRKTTCSRSATERRLDQPTAAMRQHQPRCKSVYLIVSFLLTTSALRSSGALRSRTTCSSSATERRLDQPSVAMRQHQSRCKSVYLIVSFLLTTSGIRTRKLKRA
jgi:putative transposase